MGRAMKGLGLTNNWSSGRGVGFERVCGAGQVGREDSKELEE